MNPTTLLSKPAAQYRLLLLAAILQLAVPMIASAATENINGLYFKADDATGQIEELGHSLVTPDSSFLINSNSQPNGLKVTWSTCDTGVTDTADRKSVCLNASVENVSGSDIGPVYFPDLQGMQPISGDQTELRTALGVINPFAGAPFSQVYGGTDIYERYALRWIDFGGYQGGISIYQKKWGDEDMFNGSPILHAPLVVSRAAGQNVVRIAWQNNITLKPGEKWQSDDFVFTFHRGGWAKGIEPFAQFVRKMQVGALGRQTPVPSHVVHGLGFQTVWMVEGLESSWAPKPNFTFSDIGRIAQDAKANGLDELVLFGSNIVGHLPIVLDPRAGTEAQFLAGVQKARSIGVNVSAFASFSLDIGTPCTESACVPATPPPVPGARPPVSAAAPYAYDPTSASTFWTYHSELLPAMGSPLIISETYPTSQSPVLFEDQFPNRTAIINSMLTWANKGAPSFTMDEFQDAGFMSGGLVSTMQQLRNKKPVPNYAQATISGEPVMNLERAAAVLDYTWAWNDYIEAGPFLNAVRYPRINADVSSPRVAKMAFIDGLYMNVMLSKPNKSNGSALVSENPVMSKTLKQLSSLHKEFDDYFSNGTFIGESVLSEPVTPFIRTSKTSWIGGSIFDLGPFEYQKVFIKAYQLQTGSVKKLLIFVLNNDTVARSVTFKSELGLWIKPSAGASYTFTSYDESGTVSNSCTMTKGANNIWIGTTKTLAPLQMAICEVETQ
ncbi:MAG: hypothetical protein JWM46_247 [Candidatus Kaiserbacteria bacterium]|nr:hypothetical protein [Candidatus Kaiserbacteria bacterium]